MDQINIRTIQHYLYCPHRWGLMEIDRVWAENAFVIKANLLHSRVHDSDKSYILKGKKVFTSVAVYNDDYGLSGVTDCIEAERSPIGADIYGEKYKLTIIEYKPKSPKKFAFNDEDAMQVFAQKLCVDYTFHTDCQAEIYYADIKKRVPLQFDTVYDELCEKIKFILSQMRENLLVGKIPPVRKSQKCGGCSMKDLCVPSKRHIINTKHIIDTLMEVDI